MVIFNFIGLDIVDTAGLLMQADADDVGRKAMGLRSLITDFQESFTVIEKVNIVTFHYPTLSDLFCYGISYCVPAGFPREITVV
jgi:hypothetical protein